MPETMETPRISIISSVHRPTRGRADEERLRKPQNAEWCPWQRPTKQLHRARGKRECETGERSALSSSVGGRVPTSSAKRASPRRDRENGKVGICPSPLKRSRAAGALVRGSVPARECQAGCSSSYHGSETGTCLAPSAEEPGVSRRPGKWKGDAGE